MTSARGISVRDTILWVEDTGEQDLPVIFCLHSLFLDGTMFDRLVKESADRFRVIRPDFRGQGSSAPATGDIIDMETCAEDMLALIDLMGLKEVNLVAASMGGDVAVRMVASRPALFRSLVMMGSSVRAEPQEQLQRFRDWLSGTLVTGFVGEDLDMLTSVMFGETTRGNPAAQATIQHWRKKMEMLPRSCWPAMSGVVERQSVVSLLPNIPTRTLILSGEEDVVRPPEWGREVAAGLPNAELVMLKGVGHSPILEVPETVIPQMLRFMAAVD